MSDIRNIIELQAEANRFADIECPAELELFGELLTHLQDGLFRLSERISDPRDPHLVRVLLVTRALNSLWRAREDAVNGFPVQAFALCRTSLEDWVAARYLRQNPHLSERWYSHIFEDKQVPPPPVGERSPSFEHMSSALEDNDLRVRLKQIHDILSKFVHPAGQGLSWLLEAKCDDLRLNLGPTITRRAIQTSTYWCLTVLSLFSDAVISLLVDVLGDVNLQWLNDLTATMDAVLPLIGVDTPDEASLTDP